MPGSGGDMWNWTVNGGGWELTKPNTSDENWSIPGTNFTIEGGGVWTGVPDSTWNVSGGAWNPGIFFKKERCTLKN